MSIVSPNSKIMSIEDASRWAAEWRASGKTLAVTNGVFDLLHRGHVEYLCQAAAEADGLMIAINSDSSVKMLKGPDRPVVCQADRAYILASLECVSCVVIFDGPKPLPVFKAITPDVYVKGGDYTEETLDKEEHAVLKASGARFSFIPFIAGKSTTTVIKQIRSGACNQPVADRRIEPILARRSVRKFQLRPVGKDLITEILKAGMAAPSACAKDPWLFKVVTDEALKAKIAEKLPNGPFLANASACICVVGNIQRANAGELSYMIQDCSAAMENMLLAANMLGLGACWLGIHPREQRVAVLKEIFKLDDNLIPVACMALGWPGESHEPRTRFREDAVEFL